MSQLSLKVDFNTIQDFSANYYHKAVENMLYNSEHNRYNNELRSQEWSLYYRKYDTHIPISSYKITNILII